MANLYSFTTDNCDNSGAPKLVPVTNNDHSEPRGRHISSDSLGGTTNGIIDVVNNFYWTTSPKGIDSRQEVPGIQLREKKLRTNSVIAAAAYYLMSGAQSAGTILNRASGVSPGLTSAVRSFLSNIAGLPGVQTAGNVAGSFIQQALNSAANLTTGSDISDIVGQNIEGLGSSLLQAYEGLYITEDTNFIYYLPYFDNTLTESSNSFSENKGIFEGSMISNAVESIRGAAESLAVFANFKEPGIYIERPKFFNFAEDGDTIQVNFPLINTGNSTHEDVKLNWQLIYLLTYQNRPNRRSRELIDPSCIYEVLIPGVKYIPFAYMSRIQVDFLGARRQMQIEVPTSQGVRDMFTIIPDAYEVKLTLTGLVPESKNFMAAMLTDEKSSIVDVIKYNTLNPFGEAYNIFNNNLNTPNP
jgi:hypothetical protein